MEMYNIVIRILLLWKENHKDHFTCFYCVPDQLGIANDVWLIYFDEYILLSMFMVINILQPPSWHTVM